MTEQMYHAWQQRKASALKRPTLSCGCRNDGRSTYVRGCCDRIVCRMHQDEEHTHEAEPEGDPWPSRTPTLPPSVQEGDALVVFAGGRTAVGKAGEATFGSLLAEVGEAATQSPIQKPMSVMSRLWRWVWFRG